METIWLSTDLYHSFTHVQHHESIDNIREIPDHATFREKEDTLGWLDKLGGFLCLALCNLAIFDQRYLSRNRNYHSP